jgi:quinol-cytochrome oxidoreductase complex cytochrome b subunit
MTMRFSALEQKLLLGCAAAGFVVPNGLFLYYVFVDFSVVVAAHRNPVAAAFIGEAIFLMVFFAWILKHQMPRSRNWLGFLAASIVGSLAFSVPLFVYRFGRDRAPLDLLPGRLR